MNGSRVPAHAGTVRQAASELTADDRRRGEQRAGGGQASNRQPSDPRLDGPGVDDRRLDDPRLDTSAWRVFGRRFPRRWSFYFRIVAAVLLLFALSWWFTRDVTYVENVKVSGLEAMDSRYEEPLREMAAEFAAVVTWLSERGYAWQSGGLPSLRAADALTKTEAESYLALATVRMRGGEDTLDGRTGRSLTEFLVSRGWTPGDGGLEGSTLRIGALEATVVLTESRGAQQLRLEIVN